MSEKCPVCATEMTEPIQEHFDTLTKAYPCQNCGTFRLARFGQMLLQDLARDTPEQLSVISHAIRKMTDRTESPLIKAEILKQIADVSRLPSPAEQVTNLLVWLGDNLRYFGEQIQMSPKTHTAVAGATGLDNFFHVAQELVNKGLFKGPATSGAQFFGTLTLDGWEAYERVKRSATGTRKAFMAMPFGNEQLDAVFRDCFKPSAARTGFNLQRLDEAPPAGLIDNRLRVEIRTSRFLVADLTNANLGTYWEAGFAEGLGKPVIYTCEKTFFDKEKTHFDTSHHHTVLWLAEDLAMASEILTTTIRATLPDEAIMEDPPDSRTQAG